MSSEFGLSLAGKSSTDEAENQCSNRTLIISAPPSIFKTRDFKNYFYKLLLLNISKSFSFVFHSNRTI